MVSRLALALALVSPAAAFLLAQSRDRAATFALTGDSIITQRIAVHNEPEFLKLLDAVRGAEVAFTNLEMLFPADDRN